MSIYTQIIITEDIRSKFRNTRLYIKECAGVKYFGKTHRQDIDLYNGSGIRWESHINKYGKENVKTLWVSDWFTTPEDVQDFALLFSELHNIVEDRGWANLKPENGLDGGPGYRFSDADCQEMGIQRQERSWWNNGFIESHCADKPGTDWVEGRILSTDNLHNKGKRYWNNGSENKFTTEQPGPEWSLGMFIPEGTRMWTDGVNNIRSIESPGPNWRLGVTKEWGGNLPTTKGRKWWMKGTDKLYSSECPGEGWIQTRGSWWNNGEISKLSASSPGAEWIKGRLEVTLP